MNNIDDDGNDDDEGAGRSGTGERQWFGACAHSIWSHPGSKNADWGYCILAIQLRCRAYPPPRSWKRRSAAVAGQGRQGCAGQEAPIWFWRAPRRPQRAPRWPKRAPAESRDDLPRHSKRAQISSKEHLAGSISPETPSES